LGNKLKKITDINSILLVNLGGIGDILLSIPALRALRGFYKKSTITLLTTPRSVDLMKDYPYIDKIILFNPGLWQKLKLVFILSRLHFDLAINMRSLTSYLSSLKMASLFLLAGATYRVGRDTNARGFFLNEKIPEDDIAQMHDIDYYFEIFKVLGVEGEGRNIDLKVNHEDAKFIDRFLLDNDVGQNDILIGINPGGTWPTRRWPIENFVKLIELLRKEKDFKIIITGGKKELDLAIKLVSLSKVGIINATNKTNVGQLMALIKRCNVFISNDAGPMHLAAALATPLIALFGPGDITRYDPRRISEKAVVFYNKVDCAPCFKVRCSSMNCFSSLRPEEISKAALKLV